MPEGSKLWRLAYRFAGKQKTVATGSCPVLTLAMAREAKDKAKRLLAQGADPPGKHKPTKESRQTCRCRGRSWCVSTTNRPVRCNFGQGAFNFRLDMRSRQAATHLFMHTRTGTDPVCTPPLQRWILHHSVHV